MPTVANLTSNPATGPERIPSARVRIGQIPVTDTDALFVNVADPAKIYADYRVRSRYEKDGGIWMMGITSPDGFQGDTVAFAQTAMPTLLLVVDWTAAKLGEVPAVPNPYPPSQSSPWVLLDDQVEPAEMEFLGDGKTPWYRISGIYVYGSKRPNTRTTADVTFPRPPWMSVQVPSTVPASSLANGIIFPPA